MGWVDLLSELRTRHFAETAKEEQQMTNMKQAALQYAKMRWPIFPCNSLKEPLTDHGFHDASTDPDKIEAWWSKYPTANIGFSPGARNLTAFDLDPGSSQEDLSEHLKGMPETPMIVRTPRGGTHLYYEMAEGEVMASHTYNAKARVQLLPPHIDIRSSGGYVLLPPSSTDDGEYVWEADGNAAYRTDEMMRVCNTPGKKKDDRDEWIIDPDIPENIEDAIEWLKTEAKISIDGQGGDFNAFNTGCMMHSFGISRELASDLMWEHWNPRNVPPWDGDEMDHLEAKIDSAYANHQNPPGNVTESYKKARKKAQFKPLVRKVEGKTHEDDYEEILSGDGYRFVGRRAAKKIRPPTWLINDFLPEGAYAILFGASQSFKTFVAIDIAMNVATGGWHGSEDNAWNGEVMGQGNVMFALGEGRSGITKRIRAWEERHYGGNEIEDLRFVISDPVPSITRPLDGWLAAAHERQPEGYKLIILDTVGRAMQASNENSQEAASAFTQMIEAIQRGIKGNPAVLCLHHTGHREAKRARGSSVFGADADTMARLERANNQTKRVKLQVLKQKEGAEWKEPKILYGQPVFPSGYESDTLVIVQPDPQFERLENTKSYQTPDDRMSDLDDAVMKILRKDKRRSWTSKDLAQKLANDYEFGVAQKTLQNTYLLRLRSDTSFQASHCYDSDQKTWQWQGINEGMFRPIARDHETIH